MIPRRKRGTGTIVPMRDGRFRPRLPASVGRQRLDPCATYEEAVAVLDAALAELASRVGAPAAPPSTLRGWGARWLDQRERSGATADPATADARLRGLICGLAERAREALSALAHTGSAAWPDVQALLVDLVRAGEEEGGE